MGFALILVIIGWLYVAILMAVAEVASPQGTALGALFTLVLYGVLPLAILVYVLATPLRKKRREQLERQAQTPDNDQA
ncbi:MAG: hypothetical protein RL111_2116 [Pseudomonadota bacterium]|jgi:Ca2+/H+ antiporter